MRQKQSIRSSDHSDHYISTYSNDKTAYSAAFYLTNCKLVAFPQELIEDEQRRFIIACFHLKLMVKTQVILHQTQKLYYPQLVLLNSQTYSDDLHSNTIYWTTIYLNYCGNNSKFPSCFHLDGICVKFFNENKTSNNICGRLESMSVRCFCWLIRSAKTHMDFYWKSG